MITFKKEVTISIDDEADAAYIRILWPDSEYSTTEPMLTSLNGMVNLDLDKQGRIIWIELIPASYFLGDMK